MKKTGIYLGMAALTLLSATGGTLAHAATGGTTQPASNTTTGSVAFNAGQLSMETNTLPQTLNFGKAEIKYDGDTTNIATADGDQAKTPVATDIKVTDARGDASPQGWKLQIEQGAQFQDKNQKDLKGASLQIDTGKVSNIGGTAPNTGEIEKTNVALVPNQVMTLLQADATKGDGLSTMQIKKYSLSVPSSSPKESGDYSSTITWSLSNTPN